MNCFIYLVPIILIISIEIDANKYCIPCEGGTNVVCANPNCLKAVEGACQNTKQKHLGQTEQDLILNAHNEKRSSVATGGEAKLGQASNMLRMIWDKELAKLAQCWANKCIFQHDPCRATPKHSYAGQNIAYFTGPKGVCKGKEAYQKFVDMWHSEVKVYNPNHINKFEDSDMVAGHFTQLNWAESGSVGCGMVTEPLPDGSDKCIMTCNYGPGGNMNGAPMYKQGAPCSECPSGTCSNDYPGLCEH